MVLERCFFYCVFILGEGEREIEKERYFFFIIRLSILLDFNFMVLFNLNSFLKVFCLNIVILEVIVLVYNFGGII